MALLLDIGPLSCGCTNHTLDSLYKALGERPGPTPDQDGVWAPHHDPYVRGHVEEATRRGLTILDDIRRALFSHIDGQPVEEMRKADAPWLRWSGAELAVARERLEHTSPSDYTINDWLLLVEWLVHRYLPDEVIKTEAEYLAVRAVLLGKLQANLEARGPDADTIEQIAAVVPATLGTAAKVFKLDAVQAAVIDFARARAAELITDIGDRTRHRIKQLIIRHEELKAVGDKQATPAVLQSQLLDEFAVLNRDWRRIAITETARNANEGYIASLPEGAKVRRIEAYDGACPFCRGINGLTFTVVSPERENKDGMTQVWVGKTNVGRSASPRKRVGDELVERLPSEMWWVAAGTMHPNCRGTWQRVAERPEGVDPEFERWLDRALHQIY